MKIPAIFRLNRKTLFLFLGAGVLSSIAVMCLYNYWFAITGFFLGRNVGHHTQPAFLRVICSSLGWIPFAVGGVLIVNGLWRRNIGRALSFLGGVCLPWFALVFHLFYWPDITERLSRQAFDSVEWKAITTGENRTGRIRMVDNLLKKHNPVGLSREEVVELLGEPPPSDIPFFSDYDFVYYLGPARCFMSVASEWLCIRFSDGAATDAVIGMY